MYKFVTQDGREYPLTGEVMTFGREGCDVLFQNDDLVSRQHARVELAGDGVILTDLNSTNGTYVNNRRIFGRQAINPGDAIRIGSTTLTLQRVGQAPPTRALQEPPPPGAPQYNPMQQDWSPPPAWDPGPQRAPGPPPYSQPTKDKSMALVLEFLVLGLGWIYAGEIAAGIIIMISWLIIGLGFGITLDLLTGGFACICTFPMWIAAYAISLTLLNNHMRARPHMYR